MCDGRVRSVTVRIMCCNRDSQTSYVRRWRWLISVQFPFGSYVHFELGLRAISYWVLRACSIRFLRAFSTWFLCVFSTRFLRAFRTWFLHALPTWVSLPTSALDMFALVSVLAGSVNAHALAHSSFDVPCYPVTGLSWRV
jgi:hypothetical protein